MTTQPTELVLPRGVTAEEEALPPMTPDAWSAHIAQVLEKFAALPFKYIPQGDKVLVRQDYRMPHRLAQENKPVTIPSGIVVAVGRGIFVQGMGYTGSLYKPGQHVVFTGKLGWERVHLLPKPDWKTLPDKSLSQKQAVRDALLAYEQYALVPEAAIVGLLEGAGHGTYWFDLAAEDMPSQIVAPR